MTRIHSVFIRVHPRSSAVPQLRILCVLRGELDVAEDFLGGVFAARAEDAAAGMARRAA